jgi:hypothetical protein
MRSRAGGGSWRGEASWPAHSPARSPTSTTHTHAPHYYSTPLDLACCIVHWCRNCNCRVVLTWGCCAVGTRHMAAFYAQAGRCAGVHPQYRWREHLRAAFTPSSARGYTLATSGQFPFENCKSGPQRGISIVILPRSIKCTLVTVQVIILTDMEPKSTETPHSYCYWSTCLFNLPESFFSKQIAISSLPDVLGSE